MFVTLIPTVLSFLTTAAPLLTTSVQVAGAIKTIAEIVPIVYETARDLIPEVKIAIAAIRGSGGTTSEQLDQLDALEAKIDADYDAASAAAAKEDAAAAKA